MASVSRWLVGSSRSSDIRLGGQGAHERCPRQLAARERAQRPVEVGGREAEPARHRLEPGPPRVAAGPLELALGGVVAAQDGVGRVLGHPRLELAQLGLELLRLGGPGAHVRPERVGPGERRALVVQGHARPRRHRDVAPVGLELAGEQAQERRLAGAVSADERDPVAGADDRRHIGEDLVRPVGERRGGDVHGHGRMMAARGGPLPHLPRRGAESGCRPRCGAAPGRRGSRVPAAVRSHVLRAARVEQRLRRATPAGSPAARSAPSPMPRPSSSRPARARR